MSNFVANQILTHDALNDAFAGKLDVDGSGGITVTGNASIGGALTITGVRVNVANLPTSNSGLNPGDLYVNGGVLCVA